MACVQWEVEFPAGASELHLVFYYRDWESWTSTFADDVDDCTSKISPSLNRAVFKLSQSTLTGLNVPSLSNTTSAKFDGARTILARGSSPFPTRRTRWFFAAFAHCSPTCDAGATGNRFCQGPVRVRYKMTMSNGLSTMHKHFPVNEFGLLEADIVFLLLQSAAVLLSYRVATRLAAPAVNKYHVTVAVLHQSVLLHWCALLLSTCYRVQFARTGVRGKMLWLKTLSLFFRGTGEMALLLLLIWLAKGWTIVRQQLSSQGKLRLTLYMAVYCTTYWFAVVWSQQQPMFDVAYMYDTPPGRVLVALRCAGFFWFSFACLTTHRNFHRKLRFYRKFFALFSVWFLSLPAVVLIAREHIQTYYRERVVYILELGFLVLAQAVLLVLYNPAAKMARGFPFHANTPAMLGLASENDEQLATARDPVSKAHRILATMRAQLALVLAGADWLASVFDAENDAEETDVNYDGSQGIDGRVRPPTHFDPRSFGSATVGSAPQMQMSAQAEELVRGSRSTAERPGCVHGYNASGVALVQRR